jgi:hypothetical protein
MAGHRTYRVMVNGSVEAIEKQLKEQLGKNIVTEKRFYEIDRLTGNMEEF